MLSKRIEEALNKQVAIEAQSSHVYLTMASWVEAAGYEGATNFLYQHADEERQHMLKLVHFINERGGKAIIPALEQAKIDYSNLTEVFQRILDHEVWVTQTINELVHICLEERDYTTHNFLQWYVSEQIEEEALARAIMDKLALIGNDKGGMYLFDRDIASMVVTSAAAPGAAQ
ncbi:MAG: ferritin [Flavobacteriales bacterium]|jgi:ferritin